MECKKYQIHFIDNEGRLHMKRIEDIPPSVGDEIRVGGESNERYYKITQRVWVYDEPEFPFNRVNVGIERINPEEG